MPNVGDKVTGTVQECDGRFYTLHDVEVIEPAMPVDDYPNGTEVEVEDETLVKIRDSFGTYYLPVGGAARSKLGSQSWETIARNHTVKYRPDREQGDGLWQGHTAKHWHGRHESQMRHSKELETAVVRRNDEITRLKGKVLAATEALAALAVKPRTVTTEAEYAALPVGSIVASQQYGDWPWVKSAGDGRWWWTGDKHSSDADKDLAGITRTVLREGWGDGA